MIYREEAIGNIDRQEERVLAHSELVGNTNLQSTQKVWP